VDYLRPVDASAPSDAAPQADAGPPHDAGLVPGPSELSFRVLTAPIGGRYAPRNIGAIWIEDGAGKFVKTLELWAAPRKRYLRRFLTSSNGDVTDAITGATLLVHETHEVRWDLTDRAGARVAAGDYAVLVETTDRDASGDFVLIPFAVGPDELALSPPDTEHFLDMTLTLE
jgi:hypothetical protein